MATPRSALQPIRHFILPANPLAVRTVLTDVRKYLTGFGLSGDDKNSVQIVLGEVLNNIVEHACADVGGQIWLDVSVDPEGLACTVQDDGKAMEGGSLPSATAPELGEVTDELPEGGFGWSLIQRLATQIQYFREEERNRLTFTVGFSS